MLVCNVSLRPPRRAIAVEVAEITEAVDATATGNIVFATLVDDPASVGEIVDAYLGEIMLEVASASDVVTSGSVYITAIDESGVAADVSDAPFYSDAVSEPATAADLFNASIVAAGKTAVTGELIAAQWFASVADTVIDAGSL